MSLILHPETNYAAKHDPRLNPAWRFARAIEILENHEPFHPTYDDKWIRAYVQFRREKQKIDNSRRGESIKRQMLADRFGPMWEAHEIFLDASEDRVRWELEARILARQSPEDIAAVKQSTTTDAIKLYEKLFFNVTNRLKDRSYIGSEILRHCFMHGLAHRTPELTAKYFAYFGGPLVLDLVLDAFNGQSVIPEEPHDLARWVTDQVAIRLNTSTLVGITFLEPTNFNVRNLLESYTALMSLDARANASQGDDNVINQAIEIFSRTRPTPLGDEASRLQSRPGRLIAGGAIEPRVEEVAAILRGESPNDIALFSDDWKPPVPVNPNTTKE